MMLFKMLIELMFKNINQYNLVQNAIFTAHFYLLNL
jgi:hypothetical protein